MHTNLGMMSPAIRQIFAQGCRASKSADLAKVPLVPPLLIGQKSVFLAAVENLAMYLLIGQFPNGFLHRRTLG